MKQLHFLLVATFISITVLAQNKTDTADRRFHDDLLDHLIGTWNVKSVAHGFTSTASITAEWILDHQHMHMHFKGNDIIPWIGGPMEFDYFIGFNHHQNRYIIHGISVFGNDNDEGFWYGHRTGNELKLIGKPIITSSSDTMNIQRLTWNPETNTWLIQTRPSIHGTEGEVFLDMELTAKEPS